MVILRNDFGRLRYCQFPRQGQPQPTPRSTGVGLSDKMILGLFPSASHFTNPIYLGSAVLDPMAPSLGVQSELLVLLPAYAAEAQWQKRINRSYPYVTSQGHGFYLTSAVLTLGTSSTAQSSFSSCSPSFHTPSEPDEHTGTSHTTQVRCRGGGDAYILPRCTPPFTFSLGG